MTSPVSQSTGSDPPPTLWGEGDRNSDSLAPQLGEFLQLPQLPSHLHSVSFSVCCSEAVHLALSCLPGVTALYARVYFGLLMEGSTSGSSYTTISDLSVQKFWFLNTLKKCRLEMHRELSLVLMGVALLTRREESRRFSVMPAASS